MANRVPHTNRNRTFHVDYKVQYALRRDGLHRSLVPRDEAIRAAQLDPDRIVWSGTQEIRVIFRDGTGGTLRVPVFRRIALEELTFLEERECKRRVDAENYWKREHQRKGLPPKPESYKLRSNSTGSPGRYIVGGSSRAGGQGPLGGRGRRVAGGDWRLSNALDNVVDEMIAGNLDFEVAWRQEVGPKRSASLVENEQN